MWFCPIFFLFNSNGELKTKQKDDEYSGIKHQRSGIQCETIAFRSAPKQNRCPAAHLICRRFACTCGRRGSWPRKPSCPSREARRSSWAAVRWTAGTRRWRCRSCARPRCLRRARPWTSPSPGNSGVQFGPKRALLMYRAATVATERYARATSQNSTPRAARLSGKRHHDLTILSAPVTVWSVQRPWFVWFARMPRQRLRWLINATGLFIFINIDFNVLSLWKTSSD